MDAAELVAAELVDAAAGVDDDTPPPEAVDEAEPELPQAASNTTLATAASNPNAQRIAAQSLRNIISSSPWALQAPALSPLALRRRTRYCSLIYTTRSVSYGGWINT